MARTRFIPDTGLTVRMTAVMFLLGALFVAIVVALMFVFTSYALAILIGLAGIGVAFFQWWNSDKVALRAMRAREVTPEEAPELHGMIDRLCALADMPKPRVAIADTDLPNAFATGRSPSRSVVCVTTGILRTLNAEELEGVLAHELSHVAHRDVLVMTVASSAGIVAGMVTRGAQCGRSRDVARQRQQRGDRLRRRAGGQPRRLRDQLPAAAAALALPRALRRPVRRLPDPEAVGAGLGADQDQRPDERRSRARPARRASR